ncbi:ficolin-1-A-like [Saccostrea echinata]|uniref:ficolin-1-A-like n=1 Tax=Saccostrea echinata TaxID=191078 RepID=UPI002A81ED11|nr:ficolin-1-A-like [Saccostrea echinata]
MWTVIFMSGLLCTSSPYLHLDEKDECNSNEKIMETLVTQQIKLQLEVEKLGQRTRNSEIYSRTVCPQVKGCGNDVIHKLTTKYNNSLYITMESTKNQSFEVQYSSFSISDVTDGYRLSLGKMSGNIADAFRSHQLVNYPFLTFDLDNINRCAATRGSGWWYNNCNQINLNAPFFEDHIDPVWLGAI